MAKSILTGDPLAHNDLSKIAHIFEKSFTYFYQQGIPCFSEYLQSLRTLIGLGFTAALAEKNLLSFYQNPMTNFLNQEIGAFQGSFVRNQPLAQALAEMIHIASLCFYTLNFPGYYQNFIAALRSVLISPDLSEQKEAERIIRHLEV